MIQSIKPRIFSNPHSFRLDSGESLPSVEIAYHTFGKLNSKRDNVVWVCHALTADSNVAAWWPHTIEEGKWLDPDKNFIVCANILGSHYGTTGPLSINPLTSEPWYDTFPSLTIPDMVRAHRLLASHLNINNINLLVGASVGGFQAVEWAVEEPDRFEKLVLIATAPQATPWAIAIDETQRMAIKADPTYGESSPLAGMAGMAAARAIGLLSYRGPWGYDKTQQDQYEGQYPHRASTYQQHQGDKLCRRFNAYSYMRILDAFDTHNIGKGRGGIEKVLSTIHARTLVVGITTDLIFLPEDMRRLADMIPDARYEEISSELGHDGFLVEHGQLDSILRIF